MDICVGRSRSCTCQERHAKDMLTLTCWRAKYGETVQRMFTSWFGTYCIYIYFFIWCKYQEALCKFSLPCFVFYFLFFLSGCCVSSGKYCKHSAFMIIFRYIKIKYSWKLIISLLKYCTLHKIQFAPQYIDNHIFDVATPTRNIRLFFSFVGTEKC